MGLLILALELNKFIHPFLSQLVNHRPPPQREASDHMAERGYMCPTDRLSSMERKPIMAELSMLRSFSQTSLGE